MNTFECCQSNRLILHCMSLRKSSSTVGTRWDALPHRIREYTGVGRCSKDLCTIKINWKKVLLTKAVTYIVGQWDKDRHTMPWTRISHCDFRSGVLPRALTPLIYTCTTSLPVTCPVFSTVTEICSNTQTHWLVRNFAAQCVLSLDDSHCVMWTISEVHHADTIPTWSQLMKWDHMLKLLNALVHA